MCNCGAFYSELHREETREGIKLLICPHILVISSIYLRPRIEIFKLDLMLIGFICVLLKLKLLYLYSILLRYLVCLYFEL
jgi:hypothetical protein